MKFALVLLLTGSLLVASSHLKPWPKYCAVRHVPLPIFWPHSSPYGDSDADSGDSDYVAGPGSADGRTWASGSRNAVQQRFGFQPFYRTTTTVTSTVLTAIISSCIPLNQFAGQQQVAIIQQVTSIQQDTSIQQNTSIQQPANNQQRANNVVLLSTNPCAREKRELAEDFNPSPVESLLPTAIQNFENYQVETQIASSRDEVPQPHDSFIGFYRAYRAFNVVYTFTSTSYIFNSTVIKKTLTLANPSNLLCLPQGFAVC